MTTKTEEIAHVLAEIVPDGGAALARRAGPGALAKAEALRAELAPRLEQAPAYAPLWQQFQAAPEAHTPVLVAVIGTLVQQDPALAHKLDTLLEAYRQAAGRPGTTVNTGGGAYVQGSVSVKNGDFVGRDKTVVVGDGNVIGDHSQATVTRQEGLSGDQVEALFEAALELARQQPEAVREDLETAVETAKEETEAGEDADKRLLGKVLDVLLEKGPDILELVLEAILNPAAAAGKGARMLARQAREALEKRRGAAPK